MRILRKFYENFNEDFGEILIRLYRNFKRIIEKFYGHFREIIGRILSKFSINF